MHFETRLLFQVEQISGSITVKTGKIISINSNATSTR